MFDDPPVTTAPSADARGALRPGEHIGRFTIVRLLGMGGMGAVYEARDPQLSRAVAIKILAGPSGSSSRLAREAQALAQLQHPNVVAIHEVGVAEGRRFLAMELVDGKPLDDLLKSGARSWREVLDLHVQAGRGLAAAHAKGLVHRDFKPGNVLVDRDGRARVSDFGLARIADAPDAPDAPSEPDAAVASTVTVAGDRTGGGGAPHLAAPLTDAGALLGTRRYMAPEQFAGQPATSLSDQFSFCVALWEALDGRHPFAAGPDLGGLAATVEGKGPRPPQRRWPRGLQRALTRGLSGDPTARHRSMSELLAALEAVPARRRLVALIAGATALAAAAATVALLTQTSPAAACAQAETRARARMAALWSDAARDRVKRAFLAVKAPFAADTFDRVDAAIRRQQRAWAVAHREACEATRVRGEQSDAMLDLRVQCLDRGRLQLSALIEVFARADEDTVQRAVGAAREAGDVASCADGSGLVGQTPLPPDAASRAAIADTEQRLASLAALLVSGRYDEALAQDDALIAASRHIGWPPLTARVLIASARAEQTGGDTDVAEAASYEAIQVASAAHADRLVADALDILSGVLADSDKRLAEAAVVLRMQAAAVERAGASFDQRTRLLNTEASLLDEQGDHAASLAKYQQLLALRFFPWSDEYDRVDALANVASQLHQLGHYRMARAMFERALAAAEAALGPDHPMVAVIANNLGNLLRDLGDYPAADVSLARSVRLRERLYSADSPRVAMGAVNLAILRLAQGRYDEAQPLFERVRTIFQATPSHPLYAGALAGLGTVARSHGRYDDAIALQQQALALSIAGTGDDHPSAADIRFPLGETYAQLGRRDEARALFRRVLEVRSKSIGADSPDTLLARIALSHLDLADGRSDAAVDELARDLALQIQGLGTTDHPFVAATELYLAEGRLAQGRFDEALALAQRAEAVELRQPLDIAFRCARRLVQTEALWARRGAGDRARARALIEEALSLTAASPWLPERRRAERWRATHR